MGELSGVGISDVQGEKLAGDNAVRTEPIAEPKNNNVEPKSGPTKGGKETIKTDVKPTKNSLTGKNKIKTTGTKTDVEGLFADGEKNGEPVFDVSPEEFYNNMKMDRRRLRFAASSNVSQYMKQTKYNRPFWIRNSKDGYLRKIK